MDLEDTSELIDRFADFFGNELQVNLSSFNYYSYNKKNGRLLITFSKKNKNAYSSVELKVIEMFTCLYNEDYYILDMFLNVERLYTNVSFSYISGDLKMISFFLLNVILTTLVLIR